MTLLQFSIRDVRLERVLLHFFREYLRALNLSACIVAGLLLVILVLSQLCLTVSKKPGCSGQKFLNLKIVDLGLLVPI
jgi:hypothetical protein